VVVFGVSPVLELKWSGVNEEEIHNLWEIRKYGW
jgi:hypothetical protein